MSAGNCRHVWRHEEAAPGYFTRRVCLKCGTRQRWGTEPQTDAVREYRDACRAPACSIDREAFNWNRATALLRGRDYLAKYADAAIAELEDKVEELDDKLMEAEGAHENARRWFEEQKKQFARAKKAEALRAALEQALAASEREKKVAVMFGDAFEDAAKGCHWMLEYERGLRHVIVANWMYASRADEAYAAGYDAAMQQVEFKDEALDGMHAQLREAEAEARRWEWLAKEASLGRRTPDGPLLDTLLARYEEAHDD